MEESECQVRNDEGKEVNWFYIAKQTAITTS